MKRLFDPDMFNYMWESIEKDQYIVATYYIEDTRDGEDWIEHLEQVQRLALEGSTSSWMKVKEDNETVRKNLSSKILGYFEVPTNKPYTKAAIIQLGFPIDAWDISLNIPMLWLTIAGNIFLYVSHARLLDVYFPKQVCDRFPGPRYGIEGIRKKLNAYDRPLVLHIIKPKMGMTPEETANQVYQTGLGGADLCKDDEMLSDLEICPWEKRLEKVLEAKARVERETGHKMIYMLSITDKTSRMIEKARKAAAMGADGLLITYSAGPSAVHEIASDPECDTAILLHVSHMVSQLNTISFPVFSKICRLVGSDMMLSPNAFASVVPVSIEEAARDYQVRLAPMHNIKSMWPMPAAGTYPGLAEVLYEEYGNDMIIPSGGGMLGHPMGYTAGAKAWRQALDAVVAGIPLKEASKDKPELRAALEKWGIRSRPRTCWGYMNRDFHPNFADKNLD